MHIALSLCFHYWFIDVGIVIILCIIMDERSSVRFFVIFLYRVSIIISLLCYSEIIRVSNNRE